MQRPVRQLPRSDSEQEDDEVKRPFFRQAQSNGVHARDTTSCHEGQIILMTQLKPIDFFESEPKPVKNLVPCTQNRWQVVWFSLLLLSIHPVSYVKHFFAFGRRCYVIETPEIS
jgi:hypothetical protein